MAYRELEKSTVRREVLKAAIETLTINRRRSTLVDSSYIYQVRNHLATFKYNQKVISYLKDKTIEEWRYFYNIFVMDKTPQELRIAYLSGPNPENDLKILTEQGILPENIWAFESNIKTYNSALHSILESKFPHVKIQLGNITDFFNYYSLKFDIIYLDFCGPLPNRSKKQKNLSTIISLLNNHVLNSPGVLITNFSLPSRKQDKIGNELLSKLVAYYLYSKEYIEKLNFTKDYDNLDEGAVCTGYTLDEWFKLISDNLEEFYGQFITRLIMDCASIIVPHYKITKDTRYLRNFFEKVDVDNLKDLFEGIYSVSSILNYLFQSSFNNEFDNFKDKFLSQLDPENKTKEFINKLKTLQYLMRESRTYESNTNYSDKLKEFARTNWRKKIFQFCDVFMFHQIIEFLIRQTAVPYHINIPATKRWSYISKKTRMFTDMIILDECRYLYDWMPTRDNFFKSLENIERQLVFRFILDGINRHTRWYFNDYFMGTASVDKHIQGFEYKILERRKFIN